MAVHVICVSGARRPTQTIKLIPNHRRHAVGIWGARTCLTAILAGHAQIVGVHSLRRQHGAGTGTGHILRQRLLHQTRQIGQLPFHVLDADAMQILRSERSEPDGDFLCVCVAFRGMRERFLWVLLHIHIRWVGGCGWAG